MKRTLLYRVARSIYRPIKYVLLCAKYRALYLFQKEKDIDRIVQGDTLFITHNFGGGTEQYVKNFLSDFQGNIIVLRNISYKDDIAFQIESNGKSYFLSAKRLDKILSRNFSLIIVNSLAGFYHAESVLEALTQYKAQHGDCAIKYFVHDFHAICPLFNLVAGEEYCRLECDKHKCAFHPFVNRTRLSIEQWRAVWGAFLQCADEIRCFSASSKDIFMSAYPNIKEENFSVVPHDMSYSHFTPIVYPRKMPLKVAVVGSVTGKAKGADAMQYVLSRVDEKIPFVFIGTKSDAINTKRQNVEFLGAYNHDDLQAIIEKEKATLIIFPSVCPETFSYLVSELMQMDLEIVGFDYGAQGEKLKAYRKGHVVQSKDELVSLLNSPPQADL